MVWALCVGPMVILAYHGLALDALWVALGLASLRPPSQNRHPNPIELETVPQRLIQLRAQGFISYLFALCLVVGGKVGDWFLSPW